MSRRKKAENETPDQTRERRIFESISNYPDRSDKTSWQRKLNNLETLVAELQPIEDILIDFNKRKTDIIDKITILRSEMVENCLHPYDMLVLKEDHVECKFCNGKISIPNELKQTNDI